MYLNLIYNSLNIAKQNKRKINATIDIVILSNQLCKMSCFAELMNERCGCVWYSISYDANIPVCDIENMTVGKPLCIYIDWFNYACILNFLCSNVCVLRCVPPFGVLALCKREYIRIRKWIPQAWPSFYENYLKSILVSLMRQLLVFRVTPFKIDQNRNQNRSIDQVQNLGNERRYIYKDPRQDSGQRNISYTRYPKKCFT